MDEQEREGFIKKIGISADDSDETDEDEDEDDPEHHKYNCKKCQVSNRLSQRNSAVTWSSTYPCVPHKYHTSCFLSPAVICKRKRVPEAHHGAAQGESLRLRDL